MGIVLFTLSAAVLLVSIGRKYAPATKAPKPVYHTSTAWFPLDRDDD